MARNGSGGLEVVSGGGRGKYGEVEAADTHESEDRKGWGWQNSSIRVGEPPGEMRLQSAVRRKLCRWPEY